MIAIRLKKMGTKSRKLWRVVVVDSRVSGSGSMIEEIGFYNPVVSPVEIRINTERYNDWVRKGAKPSPTVANLFQQSKKSTNAN